MHIAASRVVNEQKQTLSRPELYQLVWTTPFVKLARSLGYTYPELAQICIAMDIPRPSGGYWYRLQHGGASELVPLPPPKPACPIDIKINPGRFNGGCEQNSQGPGTSESQAVMKAPLPVAPATDSTEVSSPAPVPKDSMPSTEVPTEEIPIDVEYTRDELHKAIWREPCRKLAPKLGISDVALAKTCRKMGIPRPPRGYWARIEAGEKPRREPLPPALPHQKTQIVFRVAANRARRDGLLVVPPEMKVPKCGALEIPANDFELHPIAIRHQQAFAKAKADALGFVKIGAKDIFGCHVTVDLVPRLVHGLNAMLFELEDRDFQLLAGNDASTGLQIERDGDKASLRWSEAQIEVEREPTAEDKRRPSWTWQLKQTKASGCLSIEVNAFGIKGRRTFCEDEGRSLAELLGLVVDKLEAVFQGYELKRIREIELAKEREEAARQEVQRRAIQAESYRRAELERHERERQARHDAKVDHIRQSRRNNLEEAAQRWAASQELLQFIDFCEHRWLSALNEGELSASQKDWLAWARSEASKLEPFATGYPDPTMDGGFDASALPIDGPYPEIREFPFPQANDPAAPVPTTQPYQAPPGPIFQYWLKHRRR